MIVHDGVYEWDGKSRDGKEPICWWPGSYRIRVVDLEKDAPGMLYIRSTAVLCRNRGGSGTSIRGCIQNFAKHLSREFGLDMAKVLWVEISRMDPDDIQVANLKRLSALGGNSLWEANWRPARPNELAILAPYLNDFEDEPPEEKTPA